MDFKSFLNESYKTSITKDKVLDILKNNNENNILYRGMKDSGDYFIIDGSAGNRKSANTENYYTLIIDVILKNTDYPLRSKSIICTKSRGKAAKYGNMYVIIPLKGTKVASVNEKDIWDVSFKTNETNEKMVDLNYYYSTLELNDSSFEKFIDGLTDILSHDPSYYDSDYKDAIKQLKEVFPNKYKIEKDVIKLYKSVTDQFSLHDDASDIEGFPECWVGGRCLAIKYDLYLQLTDQKTTLHPRFLNRT